MTAPLRRTRLRGQIAFLVTAAVALLVSHDAVFLAQLGPGDALVRALRSTGHEYWGIASVVVAVLGLLAGAVVFGRLATLGRRARGLPVSGAPPPSLRTRLLPRWAAIFAIVAIGFVVQESAEHLVMHGHLIGLGALFGPEYPLAIPVIGAVTFAAALVATLVAGVEHALVARIAASLAARLGRAPRSVGRAPLAVRTPSAPPLARSAAGRAPPSVLAPVD